MTTIMDLPSKWRQDLLPASFRGAVFHVEAGAKESGRRIVLHEYPKKDLPAPNYTEDMGRRAKVYTVRGYTITYVRETGLPNYSDDYRIARNQLMLALEAAGPGVLQLPTIAPILVMAGQYRWSEEEKVGGYCTFDMTFTEFGSPPSNPDIASAQNLVAGSIALQQAVNNVMLGLGLETKQIVANTATITNQPS